MDEGKRSLCEQLVGMDSKRAADWLMSEYPIDSESYGEAILLIPHRSWKRSDQKRLAQYYFMKLPFSGPGGYEAFASFMSIKLLLECVRARLPMTESDKNLLLYYLTPVLSKSAKNDGDRRLIDDFIEGLE
ncbi:hypothetical protein P3W53_10610 [Pseudomonas denitrificans (nom. rej.)]|nr:hypothetical protein [Pseudomonas denitrificans (nom. rej.)]